MSNFKKLNLSLGWLAFFISALVYTLTVEPSASLWDCGEFIATSYKLEVGHPPGAPLFMMINRFFTLFAPDTTYVALMVNMASVVASALTIAFLFWTIVHLGQRLIRKSVEHLSKSDKVLIFGSALIGALGYAFTDTFWFSAVEGEVYAQSSLFTAVVFWAMLRWEEEADSPSSDRWLVLIAYMIGLSIGVHLLNLLAIPALVFIYYNKKMKHRSPISWWGALLISIVIVAIILFIIVPKTVSFGAWIDRMFVNNLNLPANTGLLTFILLILAGLAYVVYYTHKHQKRLLHVISLSLAVMVFGYCSYVSVVIRAVANPPMNSNAPSDPYSLLSLLNRDQYGKTPLLFGQYYSSPVVSVGTKNEWYYNEHTKQYEKQTNIQDYDNIEYAKATTTFFPRMHSSRHASMYKDWVDIKGRNVNVGNGKVVNVPTFAENLAYFFKYQVNYMYWRYFMWNFVGRQNDIQGDGGIMHGNWLSGIDFIDSFYLGNQEFVPTELKENRGHNTYFFLPFLLGLCGIFFQLRHDKDNFTVVMMLFLMTGLAIILYLNQTPNEPRERDYAYAGSFYAFSIWMGLGVFVLKSLMDKIKALKLSDTAKASIAVALSLSIPLVLLAQNYDDHDRSNRYVAKDFGYNYLESTLPGSIILPYGDNDTFPLWNTQEVLGERTDVKIANMSYLASDWYTRQMEQRTNDAMGIDLTIPYDVYYRKNEYIHVVDLYNEYIPIKMVLNFVADKSEKKTNLLKQIAADIDQIIPTSKISIPVNKENVLKSGIVKPEDMHLVVDTIFIDIKDDVLTRADYVILDMIGTADWKRPIYFTQPYAETISKFGLGDYLQYDGFAYRLVPIKTPSTQLNMGRIDTEYLYDKLMNKFRYGNLWDDINVDEFIRTTVRASRARGGFARLANQLVNEGDTVRAIEVIKKGLTEVPLKNVSFDYLTYDLLEAMYKVGMVKEANAIVIDEGNNLLEYIEYYGSLPETQVKMMSGEVNATLSEIYNLYAIAANNGQAEVVKELKEFADMY